MADEHRNNVLSLLGKTINFTERLGADSWSFTAKVLAVQIPAQGTDVEVALLLEQSASDSSLHRDYSSLSDLTFDWPENSSG